MLPGAGAPPPELAGRDELLSKASIALRRIAAGRFWRSIILTGLRGVGKTVLLNRIRQNAEAAKIITARIEVPEGRPLPSLLVPGLKAAILKLHRGKAAADMALRGLQALATFVSAMKMKYSDVEVSLDIESNPSFPITTNLDEGLSL
jgi:AAA ATPase domain